MRSARTIWRRSWNGAAENMPLVVIQKFERNVCATVRFSPAVGGIGLALMPVFQCVEDLRASCRVRTPRVGDAADAGPRRLPEHTPRFPHGEEPHRPSAGEDDVAAVGAGARSMR